MYVIVPSLLHRAEYDCFQIELSKNCGVAEWREDVKSCLLKAGINNTAIAVLFSDTQVCVSFGSGVFSICRLYRKAVCTCTIDVVNLYTLYVVRPNYLSILQSQSISKSMDTGYRLWPDSGCRRTLAQHLIIACP